MAESWRRVYRRIDERAADDLDILVLDLGRVPPGDEGHDDALEREKDGVAVEEVDF